MKKALIAFVIIAAFALGVYAQATVALFPTTQTSAENREKAVWAVCYLSGYGVVEGVEVEGAWTDNAAMWSHYRVQLINILKRKYEVAKYRESLVALPGESSYSLDLE